MIPKTIGFPTTLFVSAKMGTLKWVLTVWVAQPKCSTASDALLCRYACNAHRATFPWTPVSANYVQNQSNIASFVQAQQIAQLASKDMFPFMKPNAKHAHLWSQDASHVYLQINALFVKMDSSLSTVHAWIALLLFLVALTARIRIIATNVNIATYFRTNLVHFALKS